MTSSRIFLSPPHMCGQELRLVREAFDSIYIAPLGPMVDAFEKEFAEKVGILHAVALASGTAAMHLSLDLLGVKGQRSEIRGQRSGTKQNEDDETDEVIASTLTFIGSVSPVTFLGATPVFIDSDCASWNMDPELLEEELEVCRKRGKLPKAVIPTDLYGQCADYERILPICEKYGVPVVADAAEALGARYQRSEAGGQGSAPNNQRSEARDQRSASNNQRSEVGGQRSAPQISALQPLTPVIGMIGAGNFAGQVLLPAIQKTGARLKVIASSKGVTGTHLGKKYGFEQSTTDTARIFQDPEVDTVIITTRHNSHAHFVLEALKAGKNVFVEKPLCLTLDSLVKSRYPGENRGPGWSQVVEDTGFRLSPE